MYNLIYTIHKFSWNFFFVPIHLSIARYFPKHPWPQRLRKVVSYVSIAPLKPVLHFWDEGVCPSSFRVRVPLFLPLWNKGRSRQNSNQLLFLVADGPSSQTVPPVSSRYFSFQGPWSQWVVSQPKLPSPSLMSYGIHLWLAVLFSAGLLPCVCSLEWRLLVHFTWEPRTCTDRMYYWRQKRPPSWVRSTYVWH